MDAKLNKNVKEKKDASIKKLKETIGALYGINYEKHQFLAEGKILVD